MKQLFVASLIVFTLVFFHHCGFFTSDPAYYIDGVNGSDENSGTSESSPWKSISKVSSMTFQPGDYIYFKRGSSYSGCVTINGDGTADMPITVSAYGEGDAPRFTNPEYNISNGNALRVRGDYQIIENLYFHHCAPAPERSPFEVVWSVGALHISLGNDHVTIRNNEFSHNAKAIQSYSENSLITKNYIHDGNELQQDGFLSSPYWGPIGIHLGIGNQEVSYNTIENMYVEGGQWGGDGGAIEIDDGRNLKDNFYIHHNKTKHNMGFLEISWNDDIEKKPTSNIIIEYNISRDYQDFIYWWAENSSSRISNNTIIRTDHLKGMASDEVFLLDGQNINIKNNIIVIRDGMWNPVFRGEEIESAVHTDNCYWNADNGKVNLGLPFGAGEIEADPLFVDYAGGDYHLQPDSPASGWGALD
jgi:hypothetical protein